MGPLNIYSLLHNLLDVSWHCGNMVLTGGNMKTWTQKESDNFITKADNTTEILDSLVIGEENNVIDASHLFMARRALPIDSAVHPALGTIQDSELEAFITSIIGPF